MADILDEVLSDEKDEKRLLLFRKALPVIIALTLISASSIAYYNWHQNKTATYNREIGDKIVDLSSGKHDDNIAITNLDELAKNSSNRQAELAELKIASKLIAKKDAIGAMEKLDSIINNEKYYDITTSFARVLWVGVILDQNNISEENQTKTLNYLQYFSDEKQPFFATATLMKALFYKKNSQKDLSIEYANIVLKLRDAPMAAREQARAIIASISI